MRLNTTVMGSEQTDYSLTMWTATFRQTELETRFQKSTLKRTQKNVRISLFFGASFEVLFWLTDIAALGYNSTTQMLLAARLFVALTVAACFYTVAKYPASLRLPRLTATLAEIVAMCTFMVVIFYRPAEMHWHGMSMSIMLLVIYIFIPNNFLCTCTVALTSTAAFMFLAVKIGGLSTSDLETMAFALLFTNTLGVFALHRQESIARQEFQAREIESRALATQRQFVAMLSHEFRTPLAIIDATVQRLGFALESQQPEYLPRIEKIRRAVARILNLLDNCLTEDRLASTSLVLQAEPVDLKALIQHTYGELGTQASPRIYLNLPETPQWIDCDRHLIDIALSNIVSNALKYSPQTSPVTIYLQPERQSGKISISVEDEGSGIPPADREMIFHKFFRGEGNQGIPGSGLGLHLARELARQHGGNLTLASPSGRTGAIFTLTLPST